MKSSVDQHPSYIHTYLNAIRPGFCTASAGAGSARTVRAARTARKEESIIPSIEHISNPEMHDEGSRTELLAKPVSSVEVTSRFRANRAGDRAVSASASLSTSPPVINPTFQRVKGYPRTRVKNYKGATGAGVPTSVVPSQGLPQPLPLVLPPSTTFVSKYIPTR